MKTQKTTNIIEALFSIKFDKELQAILKADLKAIKAKVNGAMSAGNMAL